MNSLMVNIWLGKKKKRNKVDSVSDVPNINKILMWQF